MAKLNKIQRQTESLSYKAHISLKRAILEGTIPPDTRLVEEELAKSLGISRSPIREAIQRLSVEGLVVKNQSETRVCRISQKEISELFDLRIILEHYGVGLALPNINSEKIKDIKTIYHQEIEALEKNDLDILPDLNQQFHYTIMKSTNNRTFEKIVDILYNQVRLLHTFAVGTREDQNTFLNHHLRIIEALEKKDIEKVRYLIKVHLKRAKEVYLSK
jgi:DNA-binding GntR family transcriptional regulator